MTIARFLGAAALCVAPLVGAAQTLSEDEIKTLVLDTIRENPEIVMEALQLLELQQQEAQAAAAQAFLAEQQELLQADPNAPVIGNPDGDVTIVQFFDYNCRFCQAAKPELDALLAADPNVRVVMREWPVLGEGSVFAARAALAAREQGLYEPFHDALMTAEGSMQEQSVMRVAANVGLDIDQLRRDMDAPEIAEHLQMSSDLSRALGFTGTPSFVIGDLLAPGMIRTDQMATLVEAARTAVE